MNDDEYTRWTVIKTLGGVLLIIIIVLWVAFSIDYTVGFVLLILVIAGVSMIFSPDKEITCSHCGYTWQMRKPHTQDNPPANCPKCRRKIT